MLINQIFFFSAELKHFLAPPCYMNVTNKNNDNMKSNETFKQRLIGLQGNLLSFAYQLTTNKEEARDLLQDTTLKALDNEGKYVDNVNFKGWIFTIMRNIFINNYRQTVRKATVIDRTEDLYHLNISQESGLTTPEGSVAVKEISSALESFPDEYRIPFNMYVAGYKYNEIAEKIGLPLGTVKAVFSSLAKDCANSLRTINNIV